MQPYLLTRTITDYSHRRTQLPSPQHSLYKQSSNSFMTALPIKLQNYNIVMERHTELNNLIDQLNDKIEMVIDRHENQFLNAYRNHIKKIRLELDEFRESSLKVQTTGAKEQVILLEKETKLLRDELGQLFERLQGKSKEVEELKIRVGYGEKQNQWLQKEIKRLIKKMKDDKVLSSVGNTTIEQNLRTLPVRVRPIQTKDERSTTQIQFPRARRASNNMNRSHITSTNNLWQAERLGMIVKDKEALSQVNSLIMDLLRERDRKYQILKEKYEQAIRSQKATVSELESFFLECVETVRKDLYRKTEKSPNALYKNSLIDYQLFKKQDRVKILTEFVENEQVVKQIYDSIFKKMTSAAADIFQYGDPHTTPLSLPRTNPRQLHMSCEYKSIRR